MTIGNHIVKRLDDVRTLLVDNKALKFTPTEYRLLLRLLYCFRERMICCKEELEATRDSLSGAAEPSDAPRTV
jgi:hypothetical protein